ncbi:hypothetical protein PUN28_018878 [Cardiocondyla obscurior]|uniref:Uncharacterized protein n=1 Tax=Cardiocondyla obscurior TaxID=286306 RepID=A0AAW2EDS7_9HYME
MVGRQSGGDERGRDAVGGEEAASPGDQWTQPRGALHSLGYYVVSPPLRSNTMPAATYYARCYYTGRPSHLPRSVPLLFCLPLADCAFSPRVSSRCIRATRFSLSLSLPLFIFRSVPFTPFVGATRAPTASRANFDPPMVARHLNQKRSGASASKQCRLCRVTYRVIALYVLKKSLSYECRGSVLD